MGIWRGDLKKELNDKARQNLSKLPNAREVGNIIKKLLANKKIKEVPNIKDKGKNRLMASDVTPSTDLKGAWYYDDNGNVDNDMILTLKQVIKHIISQQNVAAADKHRKEINKKRYFSNIQFEPEMITETLINMILEKEIVKVKSNGMGEFSSFPINVHCYKVKSRLAKVGAFATVPCGACPRIHQCSSDGIISPATCAYYTQWILSQLLKASDGLVGHNYRITDHE